MTHRCRSRRHRLGVAVQSASWSSAPLREKAVKTGLRVMMAAGHTELGQITEKDLRDVPQTVSGGSDVLDAALCTLGVLDPQPAARCGAADAQPAPDPDRTGAAVADPAPISRGPRALSRALSAADLRRLCHHPSQAQLTGALLVLHRPALPRDRRAAPRSGRHTCGRSFPRRSSLPEHCSAARRLASEMIARRRCSG